MSFLKKHIGLDSNVILRYLKKSEKDFMKMIIPENIVYDPKDFKSIPEKDCSEKLKDLFKNQKKYKYLLGLDFNDSILPPVIKRNMLENPKWYTPYTPYQAEIA